MNRLRIFRPNERNSSSGRIARHSAVLLPFATLANRFQGSVTQAPVERARLLYVNRSCPFCKHPSVGLIELQDAVLNRNRVPIPGTATLVGFHCNGCEREWPSSLPACEPPITADSR